MRAWALLAFLAFSHPASAYFQMDLLKAKKTNNQATQWTLTDWLTQQSKQRLADQWLALHSSSNNFELSLNGNAESYKLKTETGGVTTTTTQNGQVYRADFYASIFNIYGEYEKTNDKREAHGGAAGLRLLGTSTQSTNLVVRYGWRRLDDLGNNEHWENQYAEATLRLYVVSFIGIDGGYRHYFTAKSNLENSLSGHRASAGAFIEYGIFRIHGTYFSEQSPVASSSSQTNVDRTGYEAGVTLLF